LRVEYCWRGSMKVFERPETVSERGAAESTVLRSA
jgi:hypothetical protein